MLVGTLAVSCVYPDVQVGVSTTSGETSGNGGVAATGGANKGSEGGNGGMVTFGGSTSTTGGVNSVGGKSSTGGTSNTAGTSATGGIVTTGGTMATVGGALSMGGTKSGGGGIAAGGTPSTGGTNSLSTGGTTPVATGGMKATGGTSSTITIGGAATGGSAAAGCPGNGGPSMVMLPQGYCIDSTEVTRDQYAAWLATTPTLPASTDANCGWKSTASYNADATCMANNPTYVCQGTACGNHPQVCVDWCDAYAYCAGLVRPHPQTCGASSS